MQELELKQREWLPVLQLEAAAGAAGLSCVKGSDDPLEVGVIAISKDSSYIRSRDLPTEARPLNRRGIDAKGISDLLSQRSDATCLLVAEFSYVLSVDTPLVARACDRIQVDSHAVSQ